MMDKTRLRIAIQKKGRLYTDSMDLLDRCGIKVRVEENSLFYHSENLAIDLFFVRVGDAANLVMKKVCDLGIVGENVLLEKQLQQQLMGNGGSYELVTKLGFSCCRLVIAISNDKSYQGIKSLENQRIATSYPNLVQRYLTQNKVTAQILSLSGSVEIAPRLDMADAICDLVATGRTLEENNLNEVAQVMKSQAVLIKSTTVFGKEKQALFELLFRRIQGVLKAQETKYIMFHAPRDALPSITKLLPGSETPTILPLEGNTEKVAVHLVSPEGVFWFTLEKLKAAGASSILVLPIEKMLE